VEETTGRGIKERRYRKRKGLISRPGTRTNEGENAARASRTIKSLGGKLERIIKICTYNSKPLKPPRVM